MNKSEFIDAINEKSGLTKTDCRLCLNVILDVIKSALKNGDSVTLSNFGKFKINETKSKPLYSFKTKMTEIVKAKKRPSFVASENLKQIVK